MKPLRTNRIDVHEGRMALFLIIIVAIVVLVTALSLIGHLALIA